MLAADELAEIRGTTTGREDDEGPFGLYSYLLRNVETGHVGKQHVQQDDVGLQGPDGGDRGSAVFRVTNDDEAGRVEKLASEVTEARVVIHDEHRR